MRKILKHATLLGLTVFFLGAMTGCQSEGPEDFYCLVAKRTQSGLVGDLTLTYVRKFEKINWCMAEYERLEKQGFRGECQWNEAKYDPMFEGEATGQWYLLQRIGRFSPAVIIYELDSELSDQVILHNLKQMAPHVVKFAALHRAPAEALIISPTGDIRGRETVNQAR